jgi:S-adenosylmethionine hydrolase
MHRNPILTLTTDFGLTDPFVGTMKGVIAGICPSAAVIDITHGVEAFNILDGAIKLWQAARYFPAETIHVAVVDPGVGSSRGALLARMNAQWFIAPDNGVLSWVFSDSATQPAAWALENEAYFLPGPSRTFHGRDIFAPAAAHLASGVAAEKFGRSIPTSALVRLQGIEPERENDGSLTGRILLADRFGNLLTNLRPNQLPEKFSLQVGDRLIATLLPNYAAGEGGKPFLIVGSSGLLEIAVTQGSAEKVLGVAAGAKFRIFS